MRRAPRRPRSTGATRTCIPAFRWMPAPSARGLGPEDAYRFARGEEVDSATAGRARLARPLDFLVVADHSDNMGFFPDLHAGKPESPRRPDRQAMVRPRASRWRPGRQGRAADHRCVLAREVSREADVLAGLARTTRMPGPRRSRPPRNTTTRAASRRSSVTSGPRRCRRDRTSIVSWFTATAPTRRARACRRRPMRRREAPIPNTCGNSSRTTRRRPAERCSPLPTTATCRTA